MSQYENEELLVIDGMDDALIGSALVWDQSGEQVERAIYSGERILELLMADGMSADEASEHCEFNIEGAYVGPMTPIIVWPFPEEIH